MTQKSEAAALLKWADEQAKLHESWVRDGVRTLYFSAGTLRDSQLKFERLAVLLRALGKVTK